MKKQCEANNYDACLYYGYWLVEQEKFDSAYSALTKSAENGDFSAMSALVNLYRNKDWPNHSEDKAIEWLHKIGKKSAASFSKRLHLAQSGN